MFVLRFFFNDTATTEIYTLSLHDALPISYPQGSRSARRVADRRGAGNGHERDRSRRRRAGRSPRPAGDLHVGLYGRDRKSTRLNSSHSQISYAVFCLKKKNKTE